MIKNSIEFKCGVANVDVMISKDCKIINVCLNNGDVFSYTSYNDKGFIEDYRYVKGLICK